MTAPAVHPAEMRGVTVAYGARAVLEEVDADFQAGAVTSIIGPNGAGKSTLFRAMLGLVAPRAGEIRLASRPAYVPQGEHVRLDLPLTVREVVLMGRIPHRPWWRRLSRADRDAARAALEEVGLADHAGCQIAELSGGQRQRVMVARALAQGGRLMLLDEPFTGVDAASAEAILAVLDRLRADGTAVVMSTHDLNQAARVSDRLLFLNRRVVAEGPPDQVFTAEVLRATYRSELLVRDLAGGVPLGIFDDASHHLHGHASDHPEAHEHAEPRDIPGPRVAP